MAPEKVITVFAVTGRQGQSVANSLVQNKTSGFTVRGISRDINSAKSKELASRGVNMVQANAGDEAQMVEAFRGSWAVFLNTLPPYTLNLKGSRVEESETGKTLVDAVVKAGVPYLVYSGLPSALEVTKGAISSYDFDEKAAVTEYAKTKGLKGLIIVGPGYFIEDVFSSEFAAFQGGFPTTADSEGFVTLNIPRWGGNEEMPLIAMADDFGDIVHGILLDAEAYNGQYIQAFSMAATADKVANAFQKVTGKKSRFIPKEVDSIETGGDESMEMYKSMFQFLQYSGGSYYGKPNNITAAKELKARAATAKRDQNGALMTLEGFITAQRATL